LGDNAGPSKLAAIKKHGLKALNEDQFLNLIATRVVKEGDLDANTRKKLEKEKETIRKAAKEFESREKGKETGSRRVSGHILGMYRYVLITPPWISGTTDYSSKLWTTRYAPQTLKEICGNKGQIEKLQQWLHDW